MRGLEYPHQLEITVDGERVHLVDDRRRRRTSRRSLENPTDGRRRRRRARLRSRVPVKAGPHAIGVAFLEKHAAQNPLRLQPFLRSSTDTLDITGQPHIDTFTVTGPFNADRPGRHAEPPPDLHLPSGDGAPRKSRARAGSSRRWRAARTAAGDRRRTSQRAAGVLRSRAAATATSSAASSWRCSASSPARSSCSASSAIRRACAPGTVVSRQRPRAGVAAVVLPVEQHSRRRAAAASRAQGTLQHAGRARAAGAADAGRSEVARRWSTTSPASGCTCAT